MKRLFGSCAAQIVLAFMGAAAALALAGCPTDTKSSGGSRGSVSGVTVTAAADKAVRGGTLQFTATVTASGSASTAVTWEIVTAAQQNAAVQKAEGDDTSTDDTSTEGGEGTEGAESAPSNETAAGSKIDDSGLLSVVGDETLESIEVRAVSVFDKTKSGTKTVSVTDEAAADETDESVDITVGLGLFEAEISLEPANGIIYKEADPDELTLTLTSAGYTNIAWYVDGKTKNTTGKTDYYFKDTNTVTLKAEDYSARTHNITFTGMKDGKYYSKGISFTVRAGRAG